MDQPEPEPERKVDLIALRKLAASLREDLEKEFQKSEAAGSKDLTPRADELMKDLQGVAFFILEAE